VVSVDAPASLVALEDPGVADLVLDDPNLVVYSVESYWNGSAWVYPKRMGPTSEEIATRPG